METQFRGYFTGYFAVSGFVEKTGRAAYITVLYANRVIVKNKANQKTGGSFTLDSGYNLVMGQRIEFPAMYLELPTI